MTCGRKIGTYDCCSVMCGDCLELMQALAEGSVDAIVTDPPYGLEFMGKDWDHGIPGVHFWQEALRVAKPGAHLLAFGGTRMFHRLACAIEDAGWEMRDTVGWIYGSGFPKSLDVSKAIDKAAGITERPIAGEKLGADRLRNQAPNGERDGCGTWGNEVGRDPFLRLAVTDAAKQWQGWGTALKPAWEPVIVARKPLEGTVAENVQRYGTGGINVDGCRVGLTGIEHYTTASTHKSNGTGLNPYFTRANQIGRQERGENPRYEPKGRWPANLIHDGSDEVLALFPEARSSGIFDAKDHGVHRKLWATNFGGKGTPATMYGDSGSAARFFYTAKASADDRDTRDIPGAPLFGIEDSRQVNAHPTVKPTALMRYLCRLVTPPGGVILDPFFGSGTTGKAARREGFHFLGMELSEEYCRIARERLARVRQPAGVTHSRKNRVRPY